MLLAVYTMWQVVTRHKWAVNGLHCPIDLGLRRPISLPTFLLPSPPPFFVFLAAAVVAVAVVFEVAAFAVAAEGITSFCTRFRMSLFVEHVYPCFILCALVVLSFAYAMYSTSCAQSNPAAVCTTSINSAPRSYILGV